MGQEILLSLLLENTEKIAWDKWQVMAHFSRSQKARGWRSCGRVLSTKW